MPRIEKIDPAEVCRLFRYDPDTGLLYKTKNPGAVAGCISNQGRRVVFVGARQYQGTHIAWCLMTGAWPPKGMMIDHRDGDTLNDRWDNLRLATPSQNLANARCPKDNKVGLKGASRCGSRWRAHISRGGRQVCIGRFDTAEEAHDAYCRAAKEYYGEFARGK